jgi:hypothetical protein
MKVGLHASVVDLHTSDVAKVLRPVFDMLSRALETDYGGAIQHLWIDLELLESALRPGGGPRYPFRFRKRVSGSSRFGLPAVPDRFDVGHFSVRPDIALLVSLPEEQAVSYVLQLIYQASAVLLEKQKRLGGFDANLFRARFLAECRQLGYVLQP